MSAGLTTAGVSGRADPPTGARARCQLDHAAQPPTAAIANTTPATTSRRDDPRVMADDPESGVGVAGAPAKADPTVSQQRGQTVRPGPVGAVAGSKVLQYGQVAGPDILALAGDVRLHSSGQTAKCPTRLGYSAVPFRTRETDATASGSSVGAVCIDPPPGPS